ncbi:hypothetical protein PIB30_114273, partial [Stylosanthes scabra]|nr:hypothetical protein [Stylosanthes scabra]
RILKSFYGCYSSKPFYLSMHIVSWFAQGNHVPMKKSSTTVGESTTTKETPKLESEFSEEDWKKMSLNDKAINFIHCALDADFLQPYNLGKYTESYQVIYHN